MTRTLLVAAACGGGAAGSANGQMTPDRSEVRRLGPRGEVRRYPIGHFEPYFGAHFERSVGDQVEFLRRHLRC